MPLCDEVLIEGKRVSSQQKNCNEFCEYFFFTVGVTAGSTTRDAIAIA